MQLIPLKTHRLEPGCDLPAVIRQALRRARRRLSAGDVLIVASKAVAYAEKCLTGAADFETLVRREADAVYGKGPMVLTQKNGILIANAGIDRSNVPEGQAVLWPKDPFASAQRLRAAFRVRPLGIVISDSRVTPLRRGTTGVAIGWAGMKGVRDDRGAADLFGHVMQYSQDAIADNLASAAELLMGNTDAGIPLVIARDVPVVFTDRPASRSDYFIAPDDCLYKWYNP